MNFNTSYVVIKRHLLLLHLRKMYHFNTSYVVIKPAMVNNGFEFEVYFNTSYVVIKRDLVKGLWNGIKFQYIICCY